MLFLTKYEDGSGRKQEWKYRSVIDRMNYIAVTTRPDVIFAVYQCAKHCMQKL